MNGLNQVLEAASSLVAAFSANDTEAYFAAFSEDASFVFHNSAQTLPNRAAYRALWESWQADGFRVLNCQSSNQVVQFAAENVAIFYHDVATRISVQGEVSESRERETIVFRRVDQQRWLACHEHLSAMPSL